MRILVLHNRYMEPGGEDVVFEAEVALLREHGCDVFTQEEFNLRASNLRSMRAAVGSIWSRESYAKVRKLLADRRCDIMHVHNFFPILSPSIYYAARAERVPVVQTLHNYRLLCPPGTFFRDSRVCEDCKGRIIAWPGVIHRCYRNSAAASGTVAAMLSLHKAMRTWSRLVNVYIALTEFSRSKFIEGGLPAEKIMVKGNFVHPAPARPGRGSDGYGLFLGRFHEVKGVRTLLSAWQRLNGDIPLKIVGSGPLTSLVEDAARRDRSIEVIPWLPRAEALKVLGEARVLVFPSTWYEGQSVTILEAFAMGTPVIASRLGSMIEMIEPGRTGLFFEAGDPSDLAAKVNSILAHPEELRSMRVHARREFEAKYTGAVNYARLLQIYERAIQSYGHARPIA